MKWLALLFAISAFAQTPPQLPAPLKPTLVHTAGSKRGALASPAYRNTITPANAWRWTWTHYGPGSQFIHFRFYGRTSITGHRVLLGTNSEPTWILSKTNGPIMFLECAAVDNALPKMSNGGTK